VSFRDALKGEVKTKKKKKKRLDGGSVAPASAAVFKEALLKDQRSKLERDGKRFADVEEEIAVLTAERSALKEVLTPLVKTFGEKEKDYELEDGRRLVIEKVGGGRSATKGAIVDKWKQEGEIFWATLPKKEGYENLKLRGPKEN